MRKQKWRDEGATVGKSVLLWGLILTFSKGTKRQGSGARRRSKEEKHRQK